MPNTRPSPAPSPTPAPTDPPAVSGTWMYNGFAINWETSNPYSVSLTTQGEETPVSLSLTRSAPKAFVDGAPLKMEAMLDFATLQQSGSSIASLVLFIQMASDVLFRTTIGGWSITTSPDEPDSIKPWWPVQPQPPTSSAPAAPSTPPASTPSTPPASTPSTPPASTPASSDVVFDVP